ncbi:LysR family transcriptional regulator [Pusillimonas sp. NJUB218]|uniref:LysR family transcriptional regulator n=1 Tax=Pusillimonas sp. NJUB218 TaxID=2023230 RepID=UPI000F4B11FF|nr:LysR family transcriptional regulator [Pusillimonas sp. NJUB218]ROT46708.1 hypothetical protein CHR62_01950 [Pusillimonas sp. NJUB218]
MELNELDLNLLLTFHEIMRERSVSKAAENLALAQPTVSQALSRLRATLNDDLFQRTSTGMEPTPFAEQLADPVAYALRSLKEALNQRGSFDSASWTGSFTLATTDFGEAYLLPRILEKIKGVAPGICVRSVRYMPDTLKAQMEKGEIDLAIGLLPNLEAGYYQRRLFQHDYVCLYRRSHPWAGMKLDADKFQEADHLVVESPDPGHYMIETVLKKMAVQRKIKAVVSHFGAIPYILRSTDLIATVPRIIALAHQAQFDLDFQPHPLDLPTFSVNVFWHARYNRDGANQWLRNLIFDLPSPSP